MPNSPRNADAEYASGPRLPRALRWNHDEIASLDHPLGLPHMLPSPEKFVHACARLGIDRSSHVVVYDSTSTFSSPRAAYTFYVFGHPHISVLDGGLPRWIAEGHDVEHGEPAAARKSDAYPEPSLRADFVRSYEQMVANAETGDEIVFDARAAPRYHGTAPEPRPGLPSGHIPRSLSLPFASLLTPPSTTEPPFQILRPRDELADLLRKTVGSDDALGQIRSGHRKVVGTCGSGMTAGVVWLALKELGVDISVYDESWMGYAARKTSKIETAAEA